PLGQASETDAAGAIEPPVLTSWPPLVGAVSVTGVATATVSVTHVATAQTSTTGVATARTSVTGVVTTTVSST
ncbi:MAG: hypothetical protein ACREX8_04070, partial [Gammaproteobacteria bacterium]